MAKYKKLRTDSYRRVSGEDQMNGMIREDHTQTANLPREVKMEKYPEWKYLDGAYLDDSIRGIDDLNDRNQSRVRESMIRDSY